jgi:tetratricopeptide (TPR) repeat protein
MNDEYRLENLFLEADRIIREGDLIDGVTLLQSILAEDPTFGKAHNHLAWVLETKYHQLSKAEIHYQQAIAFSPDYPAAYYNYAILLANLKKYDQLESLLQKALSVPGINAASIYNEYALMYETLGRFNDAISSYKKYMQFVYDSKLVEAAAASIERCKLKQHYLNDSL